MKASSPKPEPVSISLALTWALAGEPLQQFIAHVSDIVDKAMKRQVVQLQQQPRMDFAARKTA